MAVERGLLLMAIPQSRHPFLLTRMAQSLKMIELFVI